MLLTLSIITCLIIIKLHFINNLYSLTLLGLTPWEYSSLLSQPCLDWKKPRLPIWTLDWTDLALLISGFSIISVILDFYFLIGNTQNITSHLTKRAKLRALDLTQGGGTHLAVIAASQRAHGTWNIHRIHSSGPEWLVCLSKLETDWDGQRSWCNN